jgi:phosphohistidine phosphatase
MTAEKQLFVLRHAKSSWDDPVLDDHERPLAPRGVRAVKVLGEYVHERGIHPAQVICSSARRTRETLAGVNPGGETLIEDEVYDASCGALIDRLHRVPEGTPSVMLVGHNPAMQMLVLRLTGANGDSQGNGTAGALGGELAEVQRKFPTGALATLTFGCAWSELGPGCATLSDFVRPKALH